MKNLSIFEPQIEEHYAHKKEHVVALFEIIVIQNFCTLMKRNSLKTEQNHCICRCTKS